MPGRLVHVSTRRAAWLLLFAAGILAGNLVMGARDAEAQSISRNQFRNGALVLRAFAPAVEEPSKSTVRIEVDEKEAALGFVVDGEGYIVTKASQVADGNIVVFTRDGLDFQAELVGIHQGTDIAMLRIGAKNLTAVEWAEKEPKLGHWVVTPGIEKEPVAAGVVSVLQRRIDKQRGVLGIQIEEDNPGPRIVQIFPDSGAEHAGLRVDDRISSVSGTRTATRQTLVELLGKHGPGETVTLAIQRTGEDGEVERLEVPATLGYPFTNLLNRGEMQNQMGGELSQRRAGFSSAIQHDTFLAPEDCGGPIVNLAGEVVGMNIARAGRTESYAIPASEIRKILPALKSGSLAPAGPAPLETGTDEKPKKAA